MNMYNNNNNNEINTINILSSDVSNDLPDCAICLEKLYFKDSFLLCNHLFHVKCILKWSKIQVKKKLHPCCPICKTNYCYIKFAKNIFNNNSKIIKIFIIKLKYIIKNNKLSLIDYLRICYYICKYHTILNNIKYEKNYINSHYFNDIVINIHPTIQNIFLRTNFNKNLIQENDILIRKCRFCYFY